MDVGVYMWMNIFWKSNIVTWQSIFSPIFGMIFPDPIAMFEYVFFLMPALHDLAVNDKATSQHWLRT